MAIVRSCIIIDAVIYGVMFNANIDIDEKEPPVSWLKKSSEFWLSNQFEIYDASTPGTGSWHPIRTITKATKV